MKARVKATGEIVEIVYNGFYYESIKDERTFDKSELEIMSKTKAPDYWTRFEHKAAIVAMQGILSNNVIMNNIRETKEETMAKIVTNFATNFAHAIVEKLKEKEERK